LRPARAGKASCEEAVDYVIPKLFTPFDGE
jgi:hypothetical protein